MTGIDIINTEGYRVVHSYSLNAIGPADPTHQTVATDLVGCPYKSGICNIARNVSFTELRITADSSKNGISSTGSCIPGNSQFSTFIGIREAYNITIRVSARMG